MKTRNIVIVTRDIGGTGMGNIGMNAFMFSDNIYELPIPSFETALGMNGSFLKWKLPFLHGGFGIALPAGCY